MPKSGSISILQGFEGLPIIVVFALLLTLFMYTAPTVFLAPYIYTTFLSTLPPLILLAIGLTFVIGAGEIDLCFPAIISFSGFVFAILFKQYELGWIAVVAGLGSGLFVGYINGLLVARLGGAPDCLAWINDVSVQAIWTALIVIALWFILNRHRFGEHVLFIGDSNAVSRVVGIDVAREKIKLFTLMGGLAAAAAMLLTLENKNFFGNQGQGYLLTAIASGPIGGTSIFRGKATIVCTV